MPRRRLATLRTAAVLAVGFVVLRVVYRVVFGGGSGGGILLLDLPIVPLGGPFAGIALLGPITTGGLLSAALGALPFAAVILAAGLLGVVVDLRALFTRGAVRGPVRSISRALVVAWSTFPALRDAVARVRLARRLRAERSLASLVVPILEQTVERAVALGASMEVRGFAATRRAEPDRGRPAAIEDVALGFDGAWTLDPVDLRVVPGTLTLVAGATGSGKSTLLQAMSGVHQHVLGGDQDGRIAIGGVDRLTTPPRETAGFVGAVPQAVRLSFVAATVAEELGFALAVRGETPAAVRAEVGEAAARLGIPHLLDREVVALSAGEACLVALGTALVARPRLLLVDEPLADLDAAARPRVVALLGRLAHDDGVAVVVAEHALADWDGVADVRLTIADRTIRASDRVAPAPVPEPSAQRSRPTPPSAPIARIRALTVAHDARLAVDAADLDLVPGELVALRGPNGAGKSSLLQAMALPTARGTVEVAGVDVATLRGRARRSAVALVPEAFDDLLFETSVVAECRRADRRAAIAGTAALFLRLAGVPAVAAPELLQRHPRDLSVGQRLCLAIAIQLSARPAVLLVDEPTRGLDAVARSLVGDALRRAAEGGAAVVIATHDPVFAARVADRVVAMEGGRLAPASGAATVPA